MHVGAMDARCGSGEKMAQEAFVSSMHLSREFADTFVPGRFPQRIQRRGAVCPGKMRREFSYLPADRPPIAGLSREPMKSAFIHPGGGRSDYQPGHEVLKQKLRVFRVFAVRLGILQKQA